MVGVGCNDGAVPGATCKTAAVIALTRIHVLTSADRHARGVASL